MISTVEEIGALGNGIQTPIEEIPVSGIPAPDVKMASGTPKPAAIGITGKLFRWPKGVIVYEVDAAAPLAGDER